MILKVENLSVSFGNFKALKDVNLEVQKGEVFCLMGESGSGKSTLLYSILGLIKNANITGSIKFKELELNKLPEESLRRIRGAKISIVFQEPSLYFDPLYKIGTQIEETYIAHFGKSGARERVLKALERVGLQESLKVFHSYPHQLSGGQRQRAFIAMAIVCDPELILADEPTTALDATLQIKILDLFKSFTFEGKSVLIVTHDPEVALAVGDRVAIMKDGQILEEGPVSKVFQNPKHPYTAELLSAL
ncbi:MAG: ABC transporter ATP-binding protein [Aquificaceae bacterium]|nr:ABC transporter ATP-binding protein [Aquificaceae bacterium]MDW8237630.1 ABC transporter ATP-binding protein [Aquificaceae bacterium]